MAGGIPVNPGEVHEVSPEDGHRFVRVWRDAELFVEATKATEGTEEPANEPIVESTKGKKKI